MIIKRIQVQRKSELKRPILFYKTTQKLVGEGFKLLSVNIWNQSVVGLHSNCKQELSICKPRTNHWTNRKSSMKQLLEDLIIYTLAASESIHLIILNLSFCILSNLWQFDVACAWGTGWVLWQLYQTCPHLRWRAVMRSAISADLCQTNALVNVSCSSLISRTWPFVPYLPKTRWRAN